MDVDLDSDYTKKVMERLYSRTVKVGNGCIEYTGCKVAGYGSIGYKGKNARTHRLTYMVHNNVSHLENKELVCHSCDNPSCVNPDHLWLGTHQDNIKDCVAKGRYFMNRTIMTHCARGHEQNEVNTYVYANKRRSCRRCDRIYRDNYLERKRKKELENE